MMRIALLTFGLVACVSADCGCTQGETCCQDNSGYACCIDAESFCVPDTPSVGFPARCCPKWTVGCSVGSVGCCDPARPWQRLIGEKARNPMGAKGVSPAVNNQQPFATPKMYAVFTAGLGIHLESLTIEASGSVKKKTVTGPVQVWYNSLYGEGTRVFSFDVKRTQFHFVDGAQDKNIVLYSIDPVTGSSTSKTLNVQGYPLGFAYHTESDKFIFSVLKGSGFTFYTVDLDSGAVSVAGTIARGSGESDAAFYAGYISGLALDGTTVQRLGYEAVTTGTVSGLGSFNLTGGAPSKAKWTSIGNAPDSQFYYTFTRVQGSDDFLSLTPSSKGSRSFQIIKWSLTGEPKVLAALPNAHAPASNKIGTLGYVAAGQAGTTYGAVVIEAGAESHKWAIATLDLTTNQYQVNAFEPEFLASEGAAVSGFGVGSA